MSIATRLGFDQLATLPWRVIQTYEDVLWQQQPPDGDVVTPSGIAAALAWKDPRT